MYIQRLDSLIALWRRVCHVLSQQISCDSIHHPLNMEQRSSTNIPVSHVTRNSTDVHPRMTSLPQQQLLDQFRSLDSRHTEVVLRRTNFAHKNEVGSSIERTPPTQCTPLHHYCPGIKFKDEETDEKI
jgi:hypothetical protein